MPRTASNFVDFDHRKFAAIAPGELIAYLRAGLKDMVDNVLYVEAVHRLTALGAVVTHKAKGTSREGFYAEWRMIDVFTVEGDLISRFEMFDETDLDAAIARFEELHSRPARLNHPVRERFLAHFAARDWDAVGQDFAVDYYCDDRRRVVNAGVRRGRDAAIEDLRVAADIGLAANITSDIFATRGDRLILTRFGVSSRAHSATQDVLQVVEHNAEEQIAAAVVFDADDIDAAFEELDARYLAGEASAHPKTWSLIAQAYTAVNRHELPPTAPDWVNIDHRRGRAFAPGDLAAYLHATWDLAPNINVYVEAVHRVSSVGGVLTHCAQGSSQEGFDAEWREVILLTFEAGMVNHFEVFDEADLGTALAKLDELETLSPL